ncbi:unnamed protein product [Caenorhabditis auriculariae]|uniref:RNA-directed DNA polymerase n=1 Tax=Caenorhabditis auriculariae TaxID=2777116 RepID=A0A8S1HS86_9PELO|nr:unnamed protein product [Caenorhabditis auriculariae]
MASPIQSSDDELSVPTEDVREEEGSDAGQEKDPLEAQGPEAEDQEARSRKGSTSTESSAGKGNRTSLLSSDSEEEHKEKSHRFAKERNESPDRTSLETGGSLRDLLPAEGMTARAKDLERAGFLCVLLASKWSSTDISLLRNEMDRVQPGEVFAAIHQLALSIERSKNMIDVGSRSFGGVEPFAKRRPWRKEQENFANPNRPGLEEEQEHLPARKWTNQSGNKSFSHGHDQANAGKDLVAAPWRTLLVLDAAKKVTSGRIVQIDREILPRERSRYPEPLLDIGSGSYRKTLDEMLSKGVAEPSSSPYASPVVLVKKKDAGYWQIPLTEKAKEVTAFTTSEGLFQFTVLPFGLATSPPTFQRMMEIVLKDLIRDGGVHCYIDDVLVASKTEEEHLELLEKVLDAFRRAGLSLKASKCKIMQQQVKFLGQIIDSNGVSTDPEKIAAVKDFPQPSKRDELRSFLGLCSFYRKFIFKFGTICKPLYELISEKVKFEWTTETLAAFDHIKQELIKAPVLAQPDIEGAINGSKPFIIYTDASRKGIGAVLCQKGIDEFLHPIFFSSKGLSAAEVRYGITELEALGVIHAVRKFHQFIYGIGATPLQLAGVDSADARTSHNGNRKTVIRTVGKGVSPEFVLSVVKLPPSLGSPQNRTSRQTPAQKGASTSITLAQMLEPEWECAPVTNIRAGQVLLHKISCGGHALSDFLEIGHDLPKVPIRSPWKLAQMYEIFVQGRQLAQAVDIITTNRLLLVEPSILRLVHAYRAFASQCPAFGELLTAQTITTASLAARTETMKIVIEEVYRQGPTTTKRQVLSRDVDMSGRQVLFLPSNYGSSHKFALDRWQWRRIKRTGEAAALLKKMRLEDKVPIRALIAVKQERMWPWSQGEAECTGRWSYLGAVRKALQVKDRRGLIVTSFPTSENAAEEQKLGPHMVFFGLAPQQPARDQARSAQEIEGFFKKLACFCDENAFPRLSISLHREESPQSQLLFGCLTGKLG